MGWDDELFAVFDELEHRAEALHDLEREPELADRSRREYAAVTLPSRLMASVDTDVALEVVGVGRVEGTLRRVAATWCTVQGPGQDWVVPLTAVTLARGVSPRSVPEVAWPAVVRLGIGSALRRLADAGQPCVLRLRDGTAHEVLLHRIGADFVEAHEGAGTLVLALDAVAAVQSRDR